MKFIIACCLLVMVTATKNQKISLEDIELDNLTTEKSTVTKTPVNYNFVPYKTAQDYVRQQPREQYLQHQQQYVKPKISPPPQIRYQQQQQQQYVKQNISPPPQIRYQQQQQQQYQAVPQFYYQQPVQQSNYQQYENVQIINDNSIGQQQQQHQQYYTPYVYLQQYPSPSTSIQTVVDPKNALQYIMYIPTYVPKSEQTQNYETVVYPEQQTQQQYSEDTQYVVQQHQQQQQQQQQVAPVQYVEEPQAKTRYFSAKHEPKSLLDSYVPSILQLQYYKQQQQQQNQANSIETLYKTTQQTDKIEYTKTQPQASESTSNHNYYIPSH